ncbi:MAG: glycoside hydrolase family 28 protein [Candidatus Coproplasma sp.]
MNILAITSRSVCVEIENSTPYFSKEKFAVKLNGQLVATEERNVFSLFGLQPDTEYSLSAYGKEIKFITQSESACFNVRDFNAFGDGVHDDTPAFTAAISCLPEGGTLYVPAGTYFITPLFLKSNITLYLEKGATLLANPERTAYPTLPGLIGDINLGTWQGEEVTCFASLITAYKAVNLKIVGEGIIDCNALNGDWYVNHRVKRIAWRPFGIFFNRCKDVLLQGVTVKDTPSWNVHPYFSKDVKLYDLKLFNTPSMPTTDGIDPDTCDGVEIVGVKISVGDDCIAIKSGTFEQAKKYSLPCKNVVIRNCHMCEGHGGVVFGSELSGGIYNVKVTKCLFEGTDRGLRIKTRRGRGRFGITDNIVFDDIEMKNVKVPFVVNMYYNMGDETGHTEYVYTTEKLPVDERTPYIGNFAFSNMNCTGVEYCAGAFYGLPEAPIGEVSFENVKFSYDNSAQAGFPDMKEINQKVKNGGLYFQFVDSVRLNNVDISEPDGEPVICEGVKKFLEE